MSSNQIILNITPRFWVEKLGLLARFCCAIGTLKTKLKEERNPLLTNTIGFSWMSPQSFNGYNDDARTILSSFFKNVAPIVLFLICSFLGQMIVQPNLTFQDCFFMAYATLRTKFASPNQADHTWSNWGREYAHVDERNHGFGFKGLWSYLQQLLWAWTRLCCNTTPMFWAVKPGLLARCVQQGHRR